MKQPNPTNQWWTVVLEKAAVFNDMSDAERLVKKLKYNNPQVISMYTATEVVAQWKRTGYTRALQKNNNDRYVPPLLKRPVSTGNRPSANRVRPAQYDLFEPEYHYELDHLFGLDGWGSEGR